MTMRGRAKQREGPMMLALLALQFNKSFLMITKQREIMLSLKSRICLEIEKTCT